MIDIKIIEDAYERIRPYLTPTRLEKSLNLSSEDSSVYMKLENEQPLVKAFKIRGVLSKLTSLTEEEIEKTEISAISSGNHGVSLAYCAKKMGINRTTLSLLENGKQIPNLENLTCFCNLAKKTTDEYFSEVTRDSLVYLMGSLEEADRIKVEEAMEKIRIKEKYRLLAKRSTV